MKNRLILLALLCAVAYSCLAQVGTRFEAKDKLGNKLKYEIISDHEVRLESLDQKDASKFKTIDVPETVRYKGIDYSVVELDGGNSSWKGLMEITLPKTITELPDRCFMYSTVVRIHLPKSIRIIGEGCFYGAEALKTVDFYDTQATSRGGIIKKEAFHICDALERIDLPEGFEAIEEEAFSSCSSLIAVFLPNTLKTIGMHAFSSCKKLQEIIIPNSVIDTGGGVFAYCESLVKVRLSENLTQLKASTYQYSAGKMITGHRGFFDGCKSLKDVIIPPSVTKLGRYCFRNCESLEHIDLPNAITDLGQSSFLNCTRLKSIIIPEKVTSLLPDDESYSSRIYGCFADCLNLEEVVLPKGLKTIGENCFVGCEKLKSVKGLHGGMNLVSFRNAVGETWGPFLGIPFNVDSVTNSFSFFAESRISSEIQQWQKKKEFESTTQYRQRVNKVNQDAKVKVLLAEAKKAYLENPRKKVSGCVLGKYDADYNIFPIHIYVKEASSSGKEGYKNGKTVTKYIKVPQGEAEVFKKSFNNDCVSTTFDLVNNYAEITDVTVNINGNKYRAEKTPIENQQQDMAIELPAFELNLQQGETKSPQTSTTLSSQSSQKVIVDHSIDQNIPTSSANNTNTFAVIIGNEKYSQVAHVPYAGNDARIFAEYCRKTLGLPQKNVKLYENASYGTMIGAVSDIQKIAKAFKGDINVIFYYAGHGIPDEATGDGYLLPIDADGRNMRVCYPLSQLYKELGDMQVKSVTCFMDACFSGAQRGNGMIVAARGVAIKAKADNPAGNAVVFTAATDKQTAYPYEEKGHGMFTYYLLKKLRDTKGDCTLGELGSYVCDEVAKQAIVTNGKEQTPVVLTSQGVQDNWKAWKLR